MVYSHTSSWNKRAMLTGLRAWPRQASVTSHPHPVLSLRELSSHVECCTTQNGDYFAGMCKYVTAIVPELVLLSALVLYLPNTYVCFYVCFEIAGTPEDWNVSRTIASLRRLIGQAYSSAVQHLTCVAFSSIQVLCPRFRSIHALSWGSPRSSKALKHQDLHTQLRSVKWKEHQLWSYMVLWWQASLVFQLYRP